VICDAAAVIVSFTLAHYFWSGSWHWIFTELPFSPFLLLLFLVLFYICDLYFPYKFFTPSQTLIDILISVSSGMIIAFSLSYLKRSFAMPRITYFYAAIMLVALVLLIRLVYDLLFRSRLMNKKVLILGTGPLAGELIKCIRLTPYTSMTVAGILSEHEELRRSKFDVPVIGPVRDTVLLTAQHGAQMVIWASDQLDEATEDQITEELLKAKVQVIDAAYLYEKITGEVPHRLLGAGYLMSLMTQVKAKPYLKVKRLMDIVASMLLLVILMPVLVSAILYLGFKEGVPKIFFLQDRVGKNGLYFRLLKLRTMTEVRRGRQSVTEIGKWLRRYRIDEIPQLFNVLKGDMSLIGPRPEIPYFVDRCRKKIPLFDMVFTLNPGITGWAQVKFRYTTSVKDYERKFRFNLYYIKNISLTMDLLILLKTVRVVLLGKGE
jgi:exopolysaccharide biosynthesis polyprenyl glycosylphosphotransferase